MEQAETITIEDTEIGGMSEARFEFQMDNWRRWMRSDVVGDGLPGRSTVFLSGGLSSSFEELVDAADVRAARAVDALVQGLTIGQRVAINHTYLYAVWRMPKADLPELLRQARLRIAQGLVARGFY